MLISGAPKGHGDCYQMANGEALCREIASFYLDLRNSAYNGILIDFVSFYTFNVRDV